MTTLDPETLDALNLLLEDERASVEIDVALANGSTTLAERDTFTALGCEDVEHCYTLHEAISRVTDEVTRRINGIVLHILGLERYDERLRAYAQHQTSIREHVTPLLEQLMVREFHQILDEISETSERAAEWANQRASEFTASASFDFRIRSGSATHSSGSDGTQANGPGDALTMVDKPNTDMEPENGA